MAAHTKNSDSGLEKYLRQVDALGGHGVKVGIMADTGNYIDTQASILDVAIYNEFGTKTIPARPFIRRFAEKNAGTLGKAMDRTADAVAKGRSLDAALGALGEFAQQHQQAQVRGSKSWAVANAASTAARKGSDVPLVDQGVLVNAIRWEKV
jgi:hypothetical protein